MGPRGISIAGSVNLPNGATSVTGAAVDLRNFALFEGDSGQITLTLPALTTGELPDGQTMTYALDGAVTEHFKNPQTLIASVAVQTGAGGVGAAAGSVTVSIPRKLVRWLRIRATNSGAGNPSAKSVSFDIEY